MSRSLLFYVPQLTAATFIGLVALYFVINTHPVMKVLSLTAIPIIYGLVTPLSKKRPTDEIDRLSIQRIDRKSILLNGLAGMPVAVALSVVFTIALLFINAVIPLGIENKIVIAIAIVVTGCLCPLCYKVAEAASVRYAKTLK